MDLSQYILDSHHSQQSQAGASQGTTWEDVDGTGLCSFHIFLGILYDPLIQYKKKLHRVSKPPLTLRSRWTWMVLEEVGVGDFSSKKDSRHQAQTGRRWLKEH